MKVIKLKVIVVLKDASNYELRLVLHREFSSYSLPIIRGGTPAISVNTK